MDLLSRTEELILLAVWRLQEVAYSVEIRKELKRISKQTWSFGAVYMPLERLTNRGFLESFLTDPTPQRGGRSKRIYKPTNAGIQALLEIKKVQQNAWNGLPDPSPEQLK